MKNILRASLLNLKLDPTMPESEVNQIIRTREQAIEFLIANIRYIFKYYSESDEELRKKQLNLHIAVFIFLFNLIIHVCILHLCFSNHFFQTHCIINIKIAFRRAKKVVIFEFFRFK